MKRTLALLMILAMVLGLCACGSTTASTPTPESTTQESAAAPATEPDAAPEVPDPPEEISEAEEAPAASVSYPLEEPCTFTMTAILRNNVLAMLGDDDFTVTSAYQGLEKGTGCNIEFNMLGEATAEEKTNIALAAGDMTDFYTNLGTYGTNQTGAVQDGILFDLAPYLAEFAPDYQALLDSDEELRAGATNPDGTITVFVSQAADVVSKGIVIRQDWLDKLGLDIPTNREDLEEVLKQFQNELGATMPILVNNGLESGLSASFNVPFAGLRSVDFMLTEPNGTETVACFASENFIDYLLYLNHLYKEGYITDDFMSTGREFGNWESSYYSGKCGVWSDGFRELDPANRSNADDPNYQISPFALTDYECHVAERSTASMDGMIFVTTACQEPEKAISFINYCYTEEGRRNGLYGMEGDGYNLVDGKVELTENITNNPNGWTVNNALTWYGGGQWMPTCQDMGYYEAICAPESLEGVSYWTEAYGDKSMKLPSGVSLTTDGNHEFNDLAGDVLTLFSESAVRVVTGDLDEAGYREAIENANSMGLTRMTQLYQEALDAYLAG